MMISHFHLAQIHENLNFFIKHLLFRIYMNDFPGVYSKMAKFSDGTPLLVSEKLAQLPIQNDENDLTICLLAINHLETLRNVKNLQETFCNATLPISCHASLTYLLKHIAKVLEDPETRFS